MTRVAVVGAGVMGSATAWALRERGADVTVYEQFPDVEHDRGSSHGRTRATASAILGLSQIVVRCGSW